MCGCHWATVEGKDVAKETKHAYTCRGHRMRVRDKHEDDEYLDVASKL